MEVEAFGLEACGSVEREGWTHEQRLVLWSAASTSLQRGSCCGLGVPLRHFTTRTWILKHHQINKSEPEP